MAIFNGQIVRLANPSIIAVVEKIHSEFLKRSRASENKDAQGMIFLQKDPTSEKDAMGYDKSILIFPVKKVKTRRSTKHHPVQGLQEFEQAVLVAIKDKNFIDFNGLTGQLFVLSEGEQKGDQLLKSKAATEDAKAKAEADKKAKEAADKKAKDKADKDAKKAADKKAKDDAAKKAAESNQ